MHRVLLAFRSFFQILFHGALPDQMITELGLARRASAPAAAPAPVRTADGGLQMLAILQRDARLIDFIMDDLTPYSDDQVGAVVRAVHDQARESLTRYITLKPVVDGVENTFTRAPDAGVQAVKFIGNVPAGRPQGGILRHKGWRAAGANLPPLDARQDATIIAPAEIEIE